MKETLATAFKRELRRVISEIEQYKDEADIWRITGEQPNSGGNLALHITGNIKYFFGAILANSGFIRDREREFSDQAVSRIEIIKGLEEAINEVESALSQLSEEELNLNYPEEFQGEQHSTSFILVWLLGHLSYHLGQIDYHRRSF